MQATRFFHHNAFAAVFRCKGQSKYQLNFGNVTLLVSAKQMRNMSRQISHTLAANQPCPCGGCRYLVIQDRQFADLAFAFSYQELELLQEVLEQSLLMLEVDQLLTL